MNYAKGRKCTDHLDEDRDGWMLEPGAADRPSPINQSQFGAVPMTDPTPEAAGWLAILATKLAPAGLGALLMVAVRPPVNRRELFARVFVALTVSVLFTDFAFDLLHSFAWFAFLNEAKKSHVAAVAGLLGSVGWFIVGGVGVWLDKFRGAPVAAIEEAKKALP